MKKEKRKDRKVKNNNRKIYLNLTIPINGLNTSIRKQDCLIKKTQIHATSKKTYFLKRGTKQSKKKKDFKNIPYSYEWKGS